MLAVPMARKILLWTLFAAAAAAGAALAGAAQPADPRAALLKLLPSGARAGDLKPAPIPGIYEFTQGAEVTYLTADGRYLIDGNIYDLKTRRNLTEQHLQKARVALLDAVPVAQMLIFPAPHPKYAITVFSDVDCPYCRELHAHMAELNALGVTVRYLFYPRTGPGTPSWFKAEAVWCSPDRKQAFTRAEAGAAVNVAKLCPANPVARDYALGQEIGVRGTPAIYTATGGYIDGYLPPRDLVAQIRALDRARD